MFQLTKRTEYGLIALTHLASAKGQVASAREIKERYSLPQRLLAEVLKELCRAGLVTSHRGSNGGYSIARTPQQISIGDVVRILEDSPLVAICESTRPSSMAHSIVVTKGAGEINNISKTATKTCEIVSTCPIRKPIHRLHDGLWNLLDRTSLSDLTSPAPVTPISNGIPFNNTPGE